MYNFELLWCNGVTVAVVHEDLLLASGWHFQMINDVPRGEAYAPQLNWLNCMLHVLGMPTSSVVMEIHKKDRWDDYGLLFNFKLFKDPH